MLSYEDLLDPYGPNAPQKKKPRERLLIKKYYNRFAWYYQVKGIWWRTIEKGRADSVDDVHRDTAKFGHIETIYDI